MIDSNFCCSIWLWSVAILFVKADTQSQPEFDRKPPGRRLRKRACLAAESGSCQLFYVLFWILVVRLIHDIQIPVHVGILRIAYSTDEYVYDMHHLLMVTWILVAVGGLLVKQVFHSTFLGGRFLNMKPRELRRTWCVREILVLWSLQWRLILARSIFVSLPKNCGSGKISGIESFQFSLETGKQLRV